MYNDQLFESILTGIYKNENKMFFLKKICLIDKKQQCDNNVACRTMDGAIYDYTVGGGGLK